MVDEFDLGLENDFHAGLATHLIDHLPSHIAANDNIQIQNLKENFNQASDMADAMGLEAIPEAGLESQPTDPVAGQGILPDPLSDTQVIPLSLTQQQGQSEQQQPTHNLGDAITEPGCDPPLRRSV